MPVAARPLSGASVQGSVQSRCCTLRSSAPRCSRQRRVVHTVQAAKTADGPSVAIVGVTGAVGQEFLRVSGSVSTSNPLLMSCAHTHKHCIMLLCLRLLDATSSRHMNHHAGSQGAGFPIFQPEDARIWQVTCNCMHITSQVPLRLWHFPCQRTPLGCNLVSTL